MTKPLARGSQVPNKDQNEALEKSIDRLSKSYIEIEPFDLAKVNKRVSIKRLPVTFWLPDNYRDRFLDIQDRSSKEFGKHIQKVIMELIDGVEGNFR